MKIPGFSIDKVAAAAGTDPKVLRMENLDTDLAPPHAAIEATRAILGVDDFNSYLPFTGQRPLREAVAEKLHKQTGKAYEADQVIITCGGTEAMLDALLATISPGEEVILTDPTYAGMIGRVQLVRGVPRLVPWLPINGEWRLDLEALQKAVNKKTRAVFLMNPSMPTGAVMTLAEWQAVAELCRKHDLWLIYNAAMERILFDNRSVIHPAALEGMHERTIVIGSVSKEYRMIGWRVGWLVVPKPLAEAMTTTHVYNVVTPVGIAQMGALAALQYGERGVEQAVQIWQERRDVLNKQLEGLGSIPAAGGWSQILDVSQWGLTADQASEMLLAKSKIAATPMTNWGGPEAQRYVRLVFSNEPVARLRTVGSRIRNLLSGLGA
ncbi:MAG: pyridoxal phosphate-dependent aminotransferase [Saprospiraceae bacterium]